MGGKRSLDKGKRGEAEVRDLLDTVVNTACTRLRVKNPVVLADIGRTYWQSRKDGCDIHHPYLDWLSIEVKFSEQFALGNWWYQARLQSTAKSERLGTTVFPVLIYRRSRTPWRVRMPCVLLHSIDLDHLVDSSPVLDPNNWLVGDFAVDDWSKWLGCALIELIPGLIRNDDAGEESGAK